jgi:hypothetical protein
MEMSPSLEADSSSVGPEFSCLLWNPKVHYRLHKNPLVDAVLSQVNSVFTITVYLFKIHFNIILHLRLSFLSCFFP